MKLNKKKLIESYKGKNVYITGITGFKGSWLALVLHELGANISGIGLEPEKDSIFIQARVDEIADVVIGDITEDARSSKLIMSISKSNPDYIFHMAAQPIVSEGYKNPFHTFNTNIMGTVIMHEILRGLRSPASKEDLENGNSVHLDDYNLSSKIVSFVNVTTDKVYKESDRPLKEDDEMFGFDPYSLSKTCSDMISTCYRDAMKSVHPISTMRAGNVIGGGDMSPNRIVPDIVRASINNEKLEVRNPNSVRPYQHVFDAITAYLWIGALQRENSSYESEYNIGPDIEQTMKTHELVEKMKNYIDFEWEITDKSIGKESDYLALDNSKIKKTGWVPAFDTNTKVVKATSDWYNKSIAGEDMQEYTIKQIREAFEYVEGK